MIHLRRVWRFLCLVGMLIGGLLIIVTVFPFSGRSTHCALIQWWSGRLLRVCGVTVQIHHEDNAPQLNATSGVLMLINHVSWLDIFVINHYAATRFVAKSEIGRWPFVGALVAGAGTIFIHLSASFCVRAWTGKAEGRVNFTCRQKKVSPKNSLSKLLIEQVFLSVNGITAAMNHGLAL